MNRSTLSALAIAFATLTAGQAMAADASAPLTRDQVKAELAQAQRTGDILADGQTGMKMNELFPGSYPAKAVTAQGKTRAQVIAELAEAQRTGDILANGETVLKMNELFPGSYPAKTVTAQGKTRDQVKAELIQAIQAGTLPVYSGA
jgi:predicted RNase H-like HicB family nuclease